MPFKNHAKLHWTSKIPSRNHQKHEVTFTEKFWWYRTFWFCNNSSWKTFIGIDENSLVSNNGNRKNESQNSNHVLHEQTVYGKNSTSTKKLSCKCYFKLILLSFHFWYLIENLSHGFKITDLTANAKVRVNHVSVFDHIFDVVEEKK